MWIWQSCTTTDQHNPKLVPVGFLPKELKENSGLIEIAKDVYVGTNDSGHPAELYAFSLNQQAGSRKITIEDATNQDWEELTLDDQYVYIGDTGNNDGNRRDLCIYKVRRADLINLNMVHAEKIAFTYPGQTSFTSSSKNNFDCESMVCLGDSLYLFSKNRGNEKTDLYSLPKTPGTYQAIHRGQFNADGLVTGACIRNQGNQSQLVL
ncbi:MAG TPA: hypothetical protein VJ508_15335, partial [Saprospiraceae bacterium]|nr:hypothetical protein [Saprospiraceae bacterium]